jgi:hypothetical protein
VALGAAPLLAVLAVVVLFLVVPGWLRRRRTPPVEPDPGPGEGE